MSLLTVAQAFAEIGKAVSGVAANARDATKEIRKMNEEASSNASTMKRAGVSPDQSMGANRGAPVDAASLGTALQTTRGRMGG